MITDSLGRSFKTLRISLTQTCNFACVYCVSGGVKESKSKSNPLSAGEITELVNKIRKHSDIRTVRLTGGEPLLNSDIDKLIRSLSKQGLEVKLTTNAYFLKKKAKQLSEAGLTSINVSLDAANAQAFTKMTRTKSFNEVIDGIDEALSLGIEVKLNSVIMKGKNEDQILPMLNLAAQRRIPIRFLELMQMGHLYDSHNEHFFSEKEILAQISQEHKIYPVERKDGATARYWLTDSMAQFGIISNTSHPFCNDCNRLRMDSYGNIYGCLSSELGFSIRNLNDEAVKEKLATAILQKKSVFTGSNLSMKYIGG